jgi:hypothetical protein
MSCPRCFCRVPARSASDRSKLVCADCGTPLPPPDGNEPHVGWLGAAAVAVFSLLTTAVVIVSGVSAEKGSLADSHTGATVSAQIRNDHAGAKP